MAEDSEQEQGSPVLFRDRFRKLAREFACVLDAPSQVILWMIFDRTAGWGKRKERIPLRHFLTGVRTQKGVVAHPGTGLARSTVLRKVSEMLDTGMLHKTGDCEYSINYQWSFKDMSMLRIPKSSRENADSSQEQGIRENTTGCQREHLRVSERTPRIKIGQIEERTILKKAAVRQSPDAGELSGNLEKVEIRARKKVLQRKQIAQTFRGVPSARLIGQLWDDALVKAYPESRPSTTTQKRLAMLRGYAFRFCRMDKPRADRIGFEKFSNYMDWVVFEWGLIMDNNFAWMGSTPALPDIQFFVGLADRFEQAWQERETIEATRNMTPREAFRARLISRGKSAEAADRAVNERFHAFEETSKLIQAAKDVEQQRRALSAQQDRQTEAEERKAAVGAIRQRRQVYSESKTSGELKWRD